MSAMTERWGEAYEEWATNHRWTATTLGVATLTATLVVGLLIAGQSTPFALITGGVAAVTVLALLGLASLITGRPVLFALFGARAHRDPGSSPHGHSAGWSWGGDGGGGGGGDGGGGGGGC